MYPKLADVYEGTPKSPFGTLVWRSLTSSKTQPPRDPSTIDTIGGSGNGGNATTDSDAVVHVPAPMAFHASCAALLRGSSSGGDSSGDGRSGDSSSCGAEQALLVHGGMNRSSELLVDLWAFFPSRLSKVASGGTGGGGDVGSAGGNSDRDRTTGWERLLPQGEG